MEAENPGNRKEVDELGMEASDHPFGEEVPLFDLIVKLLFSFFPCLLLNEHLFYSPAYARLCVMTPRNMITLQWS